MKFKNLLLTLSLLFLTACPKDLPNVQGRYQGWLLTQEGRSQVVCEVPNFTDDQKLEFKLFRTKASDQGQTISLRLRKDKLYLRTLLVGPDEVKLNFDGSCASNETIKACLNGSEIHLKVKDLNTQNLILSLDIAKNNSLPEIVEESGTPHIYTLDEIMGRTRFYNYTAQLETYRARVARKNIELAARNLTPHINMKGLLISFFEGPIGLVEMAGDLLPFVFPSNWYELEESKVLYAAQKKSLTTLRFNEMNAAQNLYYLIHQNKALLTTLGKHIEMRTANQKAVKTLEEEFLLPEGSSSEFGLSIEALKQDQSELKWLLAEQLAEISHAVAIPPSNGIKELAELVLPDLSKASQLQLRDFIVKAKSSSLELATLRDLVEASRLATKVKKYEIFNPSADAAIGASTFTQIEISQEKTGEIKKMVEEMDSIIEIRAVQIVSEHARALETFRTQSASLETVQKRHARLLERLMTGESSVTTEIIDTENDMLNFEAKRLASIHAYLIAEGKLARLTRSGVYENVE